MHRRYMPDSEKVKRLMRINKDLTNPQITQIFTDFLTPLLFHPYFKGGLKGGICGNLRNLRIYNFLFLISLFFLLTASKPIPPVDMVMKLIKQPEIYGTAVIELQVIPLIAHSNLEVLIEMPEKLKLTGGSERWSGILEVDKVQTFQYSIYIPDNNIYEIKTSVKLKLLTGETVKREEILEINPTGKKKVHKKLPEKKGEGRGVIEFKGE